MPTLSLTARIRGTAERTFDVITDLRGYGRWLDTSADYTGTIDITDGPVRVGTEYVERSGLGVRRGVVTAMRSPETVTFHQPMTLRPRLLGVIDSAVTYTLTESADTVTLQRDIEITLPPALKPFAPVVVARYRKESERTLHALKNFIEAPQGRPPA
ncbi:SRPBCC family protein [Actinophytocola oryzae]|uniref:Polyketide cyclase/dehydrase/lipid transport protein n=1 Tax=Actinophytocola oryzae TaxID=502181 RepID=A0A4R7W0M1_9PSEU|nr:SRPBCC family protein [Actinophytocola oryzae]TDV56060.1 polyketide cyclase/dehydrase/lipid transport protein [Actinophytocola oryzae]